MWGEQPQSQCLSISLSKNRTFLLVLCKTRRARQHALTASRVSMRCPHFQRGNEGDYSRPGRPPQPAPPRHAPPYRLRACALVGGGAMLAVDSHLRARAIFRGETPTLAIMGRRLAQAAHETTNQALRPMPVAMVGLDRAETPPRRAREQGGILCRASHGTARWSGNSTERQPPATRECCAPCPSSRPSALPALPWPRRTWRRGGSMPYLAPRHKIRETSRGQPQFWDWTILSRDPRTPRGRSMEKMRADSFEVCRGTERIA